MPKFMINTYGQGGVLGLDKGTRPAEGMGFRAFNIHLDHADPLALEQGVKRRHTSPGLPGADGAIDQANAVGDFLFTIPNTEIEKGYPL